VDGANVVGARPDGWWRDRAAAASRLFARLQAIARGTPDLEIVLVLEGAARPGVPADTRATDGVLVVHAPASGDDEIVRQSSGAALVVTADRELRDRVAPVPSTGPSWVWSSSVAGPD
jgi:hypothetical protein